MKMIRGFPFAGLVLASAMAAADWTPQDEQACDLKTAGQFKYYVLSLSWSPEFCRSHPTKKNEPQCKQHREFIVHGLWPECGTGGPQECTGGGQADEIDKQKTYAFTPSDYLIQHEWDKHGTCSGLARSAYFGLTGDFFGKLKFPRLSGKPKADKIEALFMEKVKNGVEKRGRSRFLRGPCYSGQTRSPRSPLGSDTIVSRNYRVRPLFLQSSTPRPQCSNGRSA